MENLERHNPGGNEGNAWSCAKYGHACQIRHERIFFKKTDREDAIFCRCIFSGTVLSTLLDATFAAISRTRFRGDKVHNLVTHMNAKCQEYYSPNKFISVDESTIGFKGRVIWKCYNPNKPTKWGLRVYNFSLVMYCIDLISKGYGSGYHIFTDRF